MRIILITALLHCEWASHMVLVVKSLLANARDIRDLWVGKILWRKSWPHTPVFLPGKSHGQRRLVGYRHGVAKSQTQLKQTSMYACHY